MYCVGRGKTKTSAMIPASVYRLMRLVSGFKPRMKYGVTWQLNQTVPAVPTTRPHRQAPHDFLPGKSQYGNRIYVRIIQKRVMVYLRHREGQKYDQYAPRLLGIRRLAD